MLEGCGTAPKIIHCVKTVVSKKVSTMLHKKLHRDDVSTLRSRTEAQRMTGRSAWGWGREVNRSQVWYEAIKPDVYV